MSDFWVGFLAGFLANSVFLMVTRLIAVRFAKYRVGLKPLITSGDDRFARLLSPVFIESSKISRAFVEPLKEYLYAEVRVDDSEWMTGLWWPDNTFRILADGDMVAMILLVRKMTGHVTLGANDEMSIQDGKHNITVRVARTINDAIITSQEYEIIIDERRIIVPSK